MNRKSNLLLYAFFALTTLCFAELLYLYSANSMKEEQVLIKREFVKSIGIPDLAITTEASFIRHRSLSDFFSMFRDDAALREYFASTFVFNEPNTKVQK